MRVRSPVRKALERRFAPQARGCLRGLLFDGGSRARRTQGDSGIVYAEKPHVVVVMAEGAPNDEATALIGEISAVVREAMEA